MFAIIVAVVFLVAGVAALYLSDTLRRSGEERTHMEMAA